MTQPVAAIIVAAGSSTRMGGEVPKPYRILGEKAVIAYSYEVLAAHPAISRVLVVANPVHEKLLKAALPQAQWVAGGSSRQASVRLGLEALEPHGPELVLIHDAARPFLGTALIDRLIEALNDCPAVVPVVPVTDTIRQHTKQGVLVTLPRHSLYATQTPQAFDYEAILEIHRTASGREQTDDAALAEMADMAVGTVEGDVINRKLTTQDDWQWALSQIGGIMRVGQGFDVHPLINDPQRPLMLCGIEIPSDAALAGHSDADVGLHALVDAILGAIGYGDIGQHFPPSDAQWKNADSAAFVAEAVRLMRHDGWRLANADLTLICEKPKISTHRAAMRQRVAELLEVEESLVNIKATTTEGLGFTGRGEGIAAQAVVMVSKA